MLHKTWDTEIAWMCERVGVSADLVRQVARTSTGTSCARVHSWNGDFFFFFFSVRCSCSGQDERVKHNSWELLILQLLPRVNRTVFGKFTLSLRRKQQRFVPKKSIVVTTTSGGEQRTSYSPRALRHISKNRSGCLQSWHSKPQLGRALPTLIIITITNNWYYNALCKSLCLLTDS